MTIGISLHVIGRDERDRTLTFAGLDHESIASLCRFIERNPAAMDTLLALLAGMQAVIARRFPPMKAEREREEFSTLIKEAEERGNEKPFRTVER